MSQIQTLVCESCAKFRRLSAFYTAERERRPSSSDPLIPCKVGLCSIGGAGAPCSGCGQWHEGEAVGLLVRCGCGLAVRLEPIRFVLPWSSCKRYLPARLNP
jgi:hypothetical protein